MRVSPYIIASRRGKAGKELKHYRYKNLYSISVSEPYELPMVGIIADSAEGRDMNVFHIYRGGITLGFKGKNYFFHNSTILGRIIQRIFNEKNN